MLSIAHTDKWYQIFLSQGLGAGIGGGLIYIPSLAIQSHRWRRHRSLAMGIVFSGTFTYVDTSYHSFQLIFTRLRALD